MSGFVAAAMQDRLETPLRFFRSGIFAAQFCHFKPFGKVLAKAAKSPTAAKKGQVFLIVKKPRNILKINSLKMTVSRNAHKKQCFAGLNYATRHIAWLRIR